MIIYDWYWSSPPLPSNHEKIYLGDDQRKRYIKDQIYMLKVCTILISSLYHQANDLAMYKFQAKDESFIF